MIEQRDLVICDRVIAPNEYTETRYRTFQSRVRLLGTISSSKLISGSRAQLAAIKPVEPAFLASLRLAKPPWNSSQLDIPCLKSVIIIHCYTHTTTTRSISDTRAPQRVSRKKPGHHLMPYPNALRAHVAPKQRSPVYHDIPKRKQPNRNPNVRNINNLSMRCGLCKPVYAYRISKT